MLRRATILAAYGLVPLGLTACAGADVPNDSDQGGDTADSSQSGSGGETEGSGGSGVDSAGGGGGQGSAGGGGLAEGLEGLWSGAGVVAPGESYQGFCELFLERVTDDDREPICISGAAVTSTEVLSSCEACDFAFVVEFAEPQIEVDVDGACAQWGGDTVDLLGVTVTLGYAEGALLRRIDDAWVEIGEAEYDPMSGELFYELAYDVGP